MSFRNEHKFRLTQYDSLMLRSKLISNGMEPLYPPRCVNSLYFDTMNLRCYSESEEGVLPRKKFRCRWYADETKKQLEQKVSSIEGRFKSERSISEEEFRTIYQLGLFASDYGFVYPSFNVSYQREYFLFMKLRITFDTRIAYIDERKAKNVRYMDPGCVVEVKTSRHCPVDYVCKYFPYPMSRFSKYCRAVRTQEKSI